MNRQAYVGLWTFAVLSLPGSLLSGIIAIWVGSDKLGGTAGVVGTAGLVVAIFMGLWSIDGDIPEPLPSRDVRKRLAEESKRIHFEKELREMEIEAGLRDRTEDRAVLRPDEEWIYPPRLPREN